MAELAKTDEGAARVASMNNRVDRYIAVRIGDGAQHIAQGRIVGDAPQIEPLLEFVPFDDNFHSAATAAAARSAAATAPIIEWHSAAPSC